MTTLETLKKEAAKELPKLKTALAEKETERDTLLTDIKEIRSSIMLYDLALGKVTVIAQSAVAVDDAKKAKYKIALADGEKSLTEITKATGFSSRVEKEVRRVLLEDDEIETNGKFRAALRIKLKAA